MGCLLNIGILSHRSEGKKAAARRAATERGEAGAAAAARVTSVPPTLFAALGLGLRAMVREPWLLATGMAVAVLRRAAAWPAFLVAWALVVRGAVVALARHPWDPIAPVAGVLAVLQSPRAIALVAGLWLAGLALGTALRIAYLAGALPTLAGAMAGAPERRFASGLAAGFPRVLATAALGLVLDFSGTVFGATLAVAAWRITWSAVPGGGSPLLAAAVALALTLAVAVPLALSTVADAAVARAAVREEGPGAAMAAGAGRFLARPGTFLLAAMGFGAAALIVPGAVQGAGGVLTGFAGGAAPLLLVGPQLMIAAVAICVAAAIDLAWLGTVAALACGEDRGR
jgi:hypothetical protein